MRVTDGALTVIDVIEGVCVQTETVLRQAILERVRPILFLNKLDRVWLEKHLSVSESYKLFKQTIESMNVICTTYKDETMGDIHIDPTHLNVAFGSGYFGFGFTLNHFAKMYSSQFGLSQKKMVRKLWGNHYWDKERKEWTTKQTKASQLNGFCQFVLKPIEALFDSIMNEQTETYVAIAAALDLNISKFETND